MGLVCTTQTGSSSSSSWTRFNGLNGRSKDTILDPSSASVVEIARNGSAEGAPRERGAERRSSFSALPVDAAVWPYRIVATHPHTPTHTLTHSHIPSSTVHLGCPLCATKLKTVVTSCIQTTSVHTDTCASTYRYTTVHYPVDHDGDRNRDQRRDVRRKRI